MSLKERAHNKETANSQRRPTVSAAGNQQVPVRRQIDPAAVQRLAGNHPAALAPTDVLRLQRTIGNQAVGSLIKEMTRRRPAADKNISTEPATPARENGSAEMMRQAAQEGVHTPSSELPYARQLQRSFGRHDISGIKAHVGEAAAASARAVQAVAYTSGNHVVFGKPPDIHTAAHEAAHVVQQRAGVSLFGGVGQKDDIYEQQAEMVAARAAAGHSAEDLLDGFAEGAHAAGGADQTVVQRKVGFEFEVPEWRVTNPTALGKNTRLMNGNGWYLQNDVLGGTDYDPEFVTEAVEETDAGWRKLDTAMQDMNATLTNMDQTIPDPGSDTVANLGGFHQTARIVRRGPLIGDPQVSAGVNLSRLSTLLTALGHDPGAVTPQRMESQQLAGMSGAAANLAECTARAAQVANPVGGRVRSVEYEGLIALMGSFVRQAATIFVGYMKQAAHVMSRSRLPDAMAETDEAGVFGSVNANMLVNDVLAVANVDNSRWLFPAAMEGATEEDRRREPWRFVGRREWIRGIANGVDLLAAAGGGSSSWGGMGMEKVGPERKDYWGFDIRPRGIILELRDVRTSVPWDHWYPFAITVFHYIREVNDLTVMNPQYHGSANFGTQGTTLPPPNAPPPAPPPQPGWFARRLDDLRTLADMLVSG